MRRPRAVAALLAGLLGVLGVISYGLTACAGFFLATWVLQGLRHPERRRAAPGVRLLARGALAISLAGAAAGGWIAYRQLLVPHMDRVQAWENQQTIGNTFRVLDAAEMRYRQLHPGQGYSLDLAQLAAGPDHLGLSHHLHISRFRLQHFGYQYRYQPAQGHPIRSYRISATPVPPARGPCFVSGPLGLVHPAPCPKSKAGA